MLSFGFVVPFAPFAEFTAEWLGGRGQVSFHNLASRVRAIVCSENDLLFSVSYKYSVLKGHSCNAAKTHSIHMKFTELFYFTDNNHKMNTLSIVF